MSLEIEPLGNFVVHIDPAQSWRIPDGPFGPRSTTQFKEAVWDSDAVRARSVWANGTYRAGPRVLEVEVRAMMKTEDEQMLFVQYVGRADFINHSTGQTPVFSAGRVEAPEPGPYAWLNDTAIVGKGFLDITAGTQSYEFGMLR